MEAFGVGATLHIELETFRMKGVVNQTRPMSYPLYFDLWISAAYDLTEGSLRLPGSLKTIAAETAIRSQFPDAIRSRDKCH